MARLGDLIKPAKLIRCENNHYPVLSMTMHDGIMLQSERFKKNLASVDQSAYKVVRRGQLVVGFPIDEGVLYVQKIIDEGIMSPAYNVWDINNGLIDADYLELALHSPFSMQYYASKLRGTTARRRSIPTEDLLSLPIPLPDLTTQRRIAATLDKVSEGIAVCRQMLVDLDVMVKARFVEMFGDITDYVNITDIAHTYIGLVTTMTVHYCEKGAPLLFNSSIKEDNIIWDGTCLDYEFAEANKSRMHKTNDIITVHTGDIGTSAVVGEQLNNSLGFATIVTRVNNINEYNPRYVSSFLNYGSGKEQLRKYSRDVRNNLNLKDYNRLMVPKASIVDQNRYVCFLQQADKSKSVVQQQLAELETLKKSLMQEYFG